MYGDVGFFFPGNSLGHRIGLNTSLSEVWERVQLWAKFDLEIVRVVELGCNVGQPFFFSRKGGGVHVGLIARRQNY